MSCGCLADYNSFPEARRPTVLCANCRESATIDFRYPEDNVSCHVTCRADNPGNGSNVRVRCGKKPNHTGRHYDPSIRLEFDLPKRLRSGRTGNT